MLPMLMEASLDSARLSGKEDELKDDMKLTCRVPKHLTSKMVQRSLVQCSQML